MAPKRLLITGASGFVGGWCLRLLADSLRWNALAASDALDLRRPESVDAELAGRPPDAVLHLAAQSFVPASFEDPQGTFEVNLIGTLNLLQGLERTGFRGRFVYVSTADVYGQVAEQDMPITEGRLPAPRNPYAVSKLAAESLCRQWHFTQGLDVVVVRPFNHIGPGQDPRFVVSGLARQFARLRHGIQPERITAGDLDVSRDFSDVREVVRVYFGLLENGIAGTVYNVCSGRPTRLHEVITQLEEITGLRPEISTDPALLRAGEHKIAYGSAARLTEAIGWSPTLDLRRSLRDIYSYWEQRIADEQD
jgi:GDP-4-dehydro-6-deoxy-D-mannose reductase